MPKVTQVEIDGYVMSLLNAAEADGVPEVTLTSGAIHRRLDLSERMPMVCQAMRKHYREGVDHVEYSPPSGHGSRLCIRYQIPRPNSSQPSAPYVDRENDGETESQEYPQK